MYHPFSIFFKNRYQNKCERQIKGIPHLISFIKIRKKIMLFTRLQQFNFVKHGSWEAQRQSLFSAESKDPDNMSTMVGCLQS